MFLLALILLPAPLCSCVCGELAHVECYSTECSDGVTIGHQLDLCLTADVSIRPIIHVLPSSLPLSLCVCGVCVRVCACVCACACVLVGACVLCVLCCQLAIMFTDVV